MDSIKGGRADKANPSDFDKKELKIGIEVEMEHTDSKEKALEIAMDHLAEDPHYYSKLVKADLVDEPKALKLAKEGSWDKGVRLGDAIDTVLADIKKNTGIEVDYKDDSYGMKIGVVSQQLVAPKGTVAKTKKVYDYLKKQGIKAELKPDRGVLGWRYGIRVYPDTILESKSSLKEIIKQQVADYLNEQLFLEELFLEDNDALVVDKEVRRFMALKHDMDKEDAIDYLKQLYEKYSKLFQKTSVNFHKLVTNAIPKRMKDKVKFKYQTKKFKSVVSKIIERNTSLREITDLVRGAILFENIPDLNAWVKDFQRKYKAHIYDYEYHQAGKDKLFGYHGSHHFGLKINGLQVELQATTKRLWVYKDEAHNIYNKWRENPRQADPFDMKVSQHLFKIGNKPKHFRTKPKNPRKEF